MMLMNYVQELSAHKGVSLDNEIIIHRAGKVRGDQCAERNPEEGSVNSVLDELHQGGVGKGVGPVR